MTRAVPELLDPQLSGYPGSTMAVNQLLLGSQGSTGATGKLLGKLGCLLLLPGERSGAVAAESTVVGLLEQRRGC